MQIINEVVIVLMRVYPVLMIFVFFSNSLLAETFIREYTYNASEADSKLTSRTIALDQVKILLLQEIGTHIRQKISISKDGAGSTYASEDVEAVTAGLTKVDVLEEKWNGVTYYLKAKIEADTQQVLNALEEYKKADSEKRQQLEALKANERALEASREEISRLKRELALAQTDTQSSKVAIKYAAELDKLSAGKMFSKAYEFHQSNQFDDALYWYRKAANRGHGQAQVNLGRLYERGQGVGKDYNKADQWYRKAAEQGNVRAQIQLGLMYYSGNRVEQDYFISFYWNKKAALQGSHLGQLFIGDSYKRGVGVEQDDSKAIYWYKKSAEQGWFVSQFSLAKFYEKGDGVVQDYTKAAYWYKKAAEQELNTLIEFKINLGLLYVYGYVEEQGNDNADYWLHNAKVMLKQDYPEYANIEDYYLSSARGGNKDMQYRLGLMYYEGYGVERNIKSAGYWLQEAAAQGHQNAKQMIETLGI